MTIRTFPSVKVDGPGFPISKPVAPPGSGWPDKGEVVGDIEVARCQDGKRLQLLPIMGGEPYNFAETFQANDIDFDGYLDFSVLKAFGQRCSNSSFWVYDPSSGLFVQNQLAQKLGESCNDIAFDPEKLEIAHARRRSGGAWPWCRGADRYRVEDKRLILIYETAVEFGPDAQGAHFCLMTNSELVGGTMRVTEAQWYDAQAQPVK